MVFSFVFKNVYSFGFVFRHFFHEVNRGKWRRINETGKSWMWPCFCPLRPRRDFTLYLGVRCKVFWPPRPSFTTSTLASHRSLMCLRRDGGLDVECPGFGRRYRLRLNNDVSVVEQIKMSSGYSIHYKMGKNGLRYPFFVEQVAVYLTVSTPVLRLGSGSLWF